jgi:fused signal recognition particle receptor
VPTSYLLLFALIAVVCVIAFVVVRHRRVDAYTRLDTREAPAALRPPVPGSAGGFGAGGLGSKVRALFGGVDADAWQDLETLLIKADVGPKAAADLVERVRKDFTTGDDPVPLLHDEIVTVLGPDRPLALDGEGLDVILVVGVNGSGKTTTIGKLAALLVADGKQVSLAASDTFRAAAGEQLEIWAKRAGAHLVSQERGADPSAVAFDAVKSATARGADVLIVDTAGRLHTKQPLMDELKKVKRVIERAGADVDETLLVLDAQTGQNGIAQARAFTDAVPLTGVVLTKTDGSAKGGVVLAVREELDLPIRFVGMGETATDLRPFDAEAFADRLLAG